MIMAPSTPRSLPLLLLLAGATLLGGCGGQGSGISPPAQPGDDNGTGGIVLRQGLALGPLATDLALDPAGYVLLSSTRLDRTRFSYTYRATVVNSGDEDISVAAKVSSSAPGLTITDDVLYFGEVPAGGHALSEDTFTVTQDRTFSVTAAAVELSLSGRQPIGVEPELASSVAATVGIDGATVTATAESGTSYTLEVPAAGVPDETPVVLAPVVSLNGLDELGPLLAGVHFSPEGLTFRLPAVVRIAGLGARERATTRVFSISDDGTRIEELPFEISGTDLLVNVRHFSTVAVFGAGTVEAIWCSGTGPFEQWRARLDGDGWLTVESRASAVVATLDAWISTCNPGNDPSAYPSFAYVAQVFVDEMTRWYYAPSLGTLNNVGVAADVIDQLPTFINTALSAKWQLILGLSGDETVFDPLVADGMVRLAAALEAELRAADARCASDPLGKVNDYGSWIYIDTAAALEKQYYEALGLPGSEALFGLTERLIDLKTCGPVALRIDPAVINLSEGERTYLNASFVDRSGAPSAPQLPRSIGYNVAGSGTTTISVGRSGEVTALAPGETTVEAIHASSGIVLMRTQAVVRVKALTIDVQPAVVTVRVGESEILNATPKGGTGGQPDTCTYQWFSNSTSVADVAVLPPGTATAAVDAKSLGNATITAVCGGELGKAQVSTYNRITILPRAICFASGQTYSPRVVANTLPTNLPVTQSVGWTGGVPGIFNVSASGVLTGVAPGSGSVKATLPGSNPLQSTAAVRVTDLPICGRWDFVINEVTESPNKHQEIFSRNFVVSPGAGEDIYAVSSSAGTFDALVIGTTITWSLVYQDDETNNIVCEDFVGTLGSNGEISGRSRWSDHESLNCQSSSVESGYATFSGRLVAP
jgi:hypothetical protein